MSDIAMTLTHELVGETEFRYSSNDGKVYEVVSHKLSPDGVSNVTFAVTHNREMIQALQHKYIGGAECA